MCLQTYISKLSPTEGVCGVHIPRLVAKQKHIIIQQTKCENESVKMIKKIASRVKKSNAIKTM